MQKIEEEDDIYQCNLSTCPNEMTIFKCSNNNDPKDFFAIKQKLQIYAKEKSIGKKKSPRKTQIFDEHLQLQHIMGLCKTFFKMTIS